MSVFSIFSRIQRILFRQSKRIRYVSVKFSKRKVLSLPDRSARIRHAVQFIPLSTLSLERANPSDYSLFIHSFARSFPNVYFFPMFLLSLSHSAARKRINRQWGATKRARMWKRENEEECRLHDMQNKCLYRRSPLSRC